MGYQGLFFNQGQNGEQKPEGSPPPLTVHNKNLGQKFQNNFSVWTIDSLLESYFLERDLKIWIRANETDDKITCGELNTLLPGISKHYGAN